MAMSINNPASRVNWGAIIAGVPGFIAAAFGYITSGRWIVDFVRWLVTTGGTVAESAFLLATVYVTVNTVAHKLIAWVMPDSMILSLNQISVICFAVLPELIIFAAIKITFDHWKTAFTTRRVSMFAWAVCYTIPTSVFLGLTVYTITSFVSLEAINGAAPIANSDMLVLRCLAGWSYGMVQMLFASLGKQGYNDIIDGLRSELAALGALVKDRDSSLSELGEKVTSLEQQLEQQGKELLDARLALASQKVTRVKSDNVDSESAHTSKVTQLGASAQRSKLKKHIRVLVLNGDKLNYKKIAADTGISYNTVRRHAGTIVDEISQERSA